MHGAGGGTVRKNADACSHIKLERLAFLSLRRPNGGNVADHPRKPHGDGQAIVEAAGIVVDLSETHRVRVGARAIVLAGHLLNSLVRNSGIRRERLLLRYQQKIPTKRTAAANFCVHFQCVAKKVLKIRNRANALSCRYY